VIRQEYSAVAGHLLYDVFSMRFGYLIAVGKTDRAFKSFDEAKAFAKRHPLTTSHLASEYQSFNLAHDLKLGSADEHLFDENLTDEQRLWLVDFCRRWDSAVAFEDDTYGRDNPLAPATSSA
jgi:hypothetical protein